MQAMPAVKIIKKLVKIMYFMQYLALKVVEIGYA